MKESMPKSWVTKLGIFQAALSLLNTKDIDDITIRGIAKAAGVSTGTFYYYYKTKFDVFNDSYQFMDDYFENVVAASLPETGAWDRLTYFFQQYHYYNTERTPFKLYKLLTTYAYNQYPAKFGYGMQRVLKSIVADAQKSGEIDGTETPEEIVHFLLTCMRGCYRHWVITDNTCDIGRMAQSFVGKLLSIYLTPPAGVALPRKTKAGDQGRD